MDEPWPFDNSQQVLDAAWDEFHEWCLTVTRDAPASFVALSLRGLEPPELSKLMDIAIMSWRRRWGDLAEGAMRDKGLI